MTKKNTKPKLEIVPLFHGKTDAPIVIVGDSPSIDDFQTDTYLNKDYPFVMSFLEEAGLKREDVLFLSIGDAPCHIKGGYSEQELREFGCKSLAPAILKHPRKHVIVAGTSGCVAMGILPKKKGLMKTRMTPYTLSACQTGRHITAITTDPFDENVENAEVVHGIQCTTTQSLFVVTADPDSVEDIQQDVRFALKVMAGESSVDLPEIEIRDIVTPSDVRNLHKKILKTSERKVAYDTETSGLDRRRVILFTNALYFGERNKYGQPVVYFFAAYDRLECLYSDEEMAELNQAWRELYEDEDLKWIAHNIKYDDMVIRKTYGTKHFTSWRDTRVEKWGVNSVTFNSLKDTVAQYLGYPRYDGVIDDFVSAVAKRRGRNLVHDDDFKTLDFLGLEPMKVLLKKGKTSYKWPKHLADTKECIYGLVDMPTLRLYNAYDALFTWMLHEVFQPLIKQWGLEKSQDFRHSMSHCCFEMMETGVAVDIKWNRDAEEDCAKIIDRCQREMREMLLERGFDTKFVEEFNPNSDKQVCQVLFGKPIPLWKVDESHIRQLQNLDRNRQWPWVYVDRSTGEVKVSERKFAETVREIHNAAYGENYGKVRKMGAQFNFDRAREIIESRWEEIMGRVPNTIQVEEYAVGPVAPIVFTKTGQPSVARVVLEHIYSVTNDEWLRVFLMYRRASKLSGTFIKGIYNGLDDHGILHIGYNEIGPQGGRISSYAPNGQNFPKAIRGQIVARPGYTIYTWDLAQAEVRIMAALSGDKMLLEDCNNDRDLHKIFASRVFGVPEDEVTKDQRQSTKAVVFGIIYGIGVDKLAVSIGKTVEEAEDLIEVFYSTYPRVREWREKQIAMAKEPPFATRTVIGTKRSSLAIKSRNMKIASKAERVACNQPIQGTGGELAFYYGEDQLARFYESVDSSPELQRIEEQYDFIVRPMLQVHDSFSFEVLDHPLVREAWEKAVVDSFAAACRWKPLHKVLIAYEGAWESRWDTPEGETPVLLKAIDPEYNTDKAKFPWYLIAPDMLDKEDMAELDDEVLT
jgi:DNA polymerase I-like protein with 3'-5' exonuclease and polymerase domains